MAVNDHPGKDLWSLPWEADLSPGTGSAQIGTCANAYVPEPCLHVPSSDQFGLDVLEMEPGQLSSQEESLLLGTCSRLQRDAALCTPSAATLVLGPESSEADVELASASRIEASLHDDCLAGPPSPDLLRDLTDILQWAEGETREPGVGEADRHREEDEALPGARDGCSHFGGNAGAADRAGDEGVTTTEGNRPSLGSGGAMEPGTTESDPSSSGATTSHASLGSLQHSAIQASSTGHGRSSPEDDNSLNSMYLDSRYMESRFQILEPNSEMNASRQPLARGMPRPPLTPLEASATCTRGVPDPREDSSLLRPWPPHQQKSALAARLAGVLCSISAEKARKRRGDDVRSSALIKSLMAQAHENGNTITRRHLARGSAPAESTALPDLDHVLTPLQRPAACLGRLTDGAAADAAEQPEKRPKHNQRHQGAGKDNGFIPPQQGAHTPCVPEAATGWVLRPCASLDALTLRRKDLLACPPDARRYWDPQFRKEAKAQLMRLATAYSTGCWEDAQRQLLLLRKVASPHGSVTQRLVHYVLAGLLARFEGTPVPEQLLHEVAAQGHSLKPILVRSQESLARSWGGFPGLAATEALAHALQGERSIHIVVCTSLICPDWRQLFTRLVLHATSASTSTGTGTGTGAGTGTSTDSSGHTGGIGCRDPQTEGNSERGAQTGTDTARARDWDRDRDSDRGTGTLRVRVTFLIPAVGSFASVEAQRLFLDLAEDVTEAAAQTPAAYPGAAPLAVAVECRQVFFFPKDFNPGLVEVRPGEALAVACLLGLQIFPDASVLRSDPRSRFIKWVRDMDARTLVIVETDAPLNNPFFLARFEEVVRTGEMHLDNLDATVIQFTTDATRVQEASIECFVSEDVENCVSADGLLRYVRPESAPQWRDRVAAQGFQGQRFTQRAVAAMRAACVHAHLSIVEEDGLVNLKWKGSPFVFAGAWVPPRKGKERKKCLTPGPRREGGHGRLG